MQPRVAVVVSSLGRPECLAALWARLCVQTLKPHRVVFSVVSTGDAPSGLAASADASPPEVVLSPKGLTKQRNRGIDRVIDDADVIAFLDDDYVPSRHALAGIARAFDAHPSASGITGMILADGVRGGGIGEEEASAIVDRWDAAHPMDERDDAPRVIARLDGLYGCNMAWRVSAMGATRFDERLPLYGWLEDIDFAARVPGEKVKVDSFAGVHRGVKGGRERRGCLLGYSQIANPLYMYRKGTISSRFALRLCLRNLLSNHLRAFSPEPWIDRRGRMRGNWQAIRDAARGRADPARILDLA